MVWFRDPRWSTSGLLAASPTAFGIHIGMHFPLRVEPVRHLGAGADRMRAARALVRQPVAIAWIAV